MKIKLFLSSLVFMCFMSAYSQTSYTCTTAGTGALQALTSWTNSVGGNPPNFTTANCTYVINTATATIAGNWTVTGVGSVVQIGDGVSATSFSVASPRTFSTTATVNVMGNSTLTAVSGSTITGTVNVANTANLIIQSATTPTLGTLASGSTVTYSRAGAQPVANAAYGNLTLGGSGNKTLANTANTSVAGVLNIGAGFAFLLNTNPSYTLSLNGTLTGTGTITGGVSSNLSIGGTGAFGTIIPTAAPSFTLNTLTLNRGGLGNVTLGGNVTVNTACNFSNGILTLNGKTLTLNGAVTFPVSSANGSITSSASSNLSIGASSITNPLIFTSAVASLNNFTLNSLGQTLTLGNDLIVAGAFVHTAGILNLNGKTLSLGGATTFALSTKGSVSGSGTSNLDLSSTTLVDSLFMTPGAETLNNLTLNSTIATVRTLNLGSSLTISGTFTQTKGIVKLNGQTLTLSGAVVFPTLSTQGTITGSAASTLSITATSITNSLFMTAGVALGNFTLDSPGKTLTLGNALSVSGAFNQTNGNINLNGQTLTLSGAATFPAAYSNGSIIGSTTPTLSITATSITNPLLMDQTTPGTSNMLKTLVFNSPGQTLLLGNDLKDSIYTHTAGILGLNGNTLTLTGATTFALSTKGSISGSATSNLLLSSSTITDSLFMTSGAQTLNNFTLNSATAAVRTLILGTPLTIGGAFNQTKGIIKLNGQTLTLNGTAAFTSAAAQGTITGSATSNLLINASSITTNTLFLTGGGTTLNNFTLNSPGQTLIMGSALTVSGAFNQTNGKLGLNGLALTLSGSATFPAAYSNGSIIGSATSTLSITATGITNSLFMDQTTPGTTNEVKILVLNSAGQTLTLGNNLMVITGGTYTHTNGIVDLNGQTLTLNGAITFATPIANGSYTGSSTSAISIGGAAGGVITNSLLMTQTNSSTNSLSNLTFNRNTKTLIIGNALNVIDSICPTLGTLNIGSNVTLVADQSTVGHVGRIGRVGGTLTSTSITSQVYHNPPTGNTTNWMLMGVAGVTNAPFTQWGNSFQITCASCAAGDGSAQNGGTPFSSITTYTESTDTYPGIASDASTIVPGVGYWVFMGNSYYGNSSSPELITVTGTPKTGNFTWPTLTSTGATADKGYNLLSNPYPSPISWSKVMARNPGLAAANPQLSTLNVYSATYNGGDYLTYNTSSSLGVPSYAVGTNSINDVIPAGGGFYVITTAASITTLSVTEKEKVSGNNNNFLFKQSNQTKAQTTPFISLVVSGGTNNNSSEAVIGFNANATTGIDAYDSQAFPWNNALQITTIIQGAAYTINTFPLLSQGFSVPVQIRSGVTSQYTLTPMNLQNIAAGACIKLHDNYTNIDYDLRQGAVTLTINDTETVARFTLNVTIDPSLSASGSSQNPTCANSANGYLTASASGSAPWNYYWKDANNNIIKTSLNKTTSDTLYNANAGNYSVDINSVGSCNNGSVSYTLHGVQSANALFTPSTYSAGLVNDSATVVFTNTSINADSYLWDFGDGSQSTDPNPTYIYSGAGDYLVTLTAYNQACGDNSVYTQVITVDTVAYTTGIKSFASQENNMQINKDASGYYVQFNFTEKTGAVISVQNLLGEKVAADIKQENVLNNKTYVSLGNTENNILIISVITSSGEKTFRKVINY